MGKGTVFAVVAAFLRKKKDREMDHEQHRHFTTEGMLTDRSKENDSLHEMRSIIMEPFNSDEKMSDDKMAQPLYKTGMMDEEETSDPYRKVPGDGVLHNLYKGGQDDETENPYSMIQGDKITEDLHGPIRDDDATVSPYVQMVDDEVTVNPYSRLLDDDVTENPYDRMIDDEVTVNPYSRLLDNEITVNPYDRIQDDEATENPFSVFSASSHMCEDEEETVNPYALDWMPRLTVGFIIENIQGSKRERVTFSGSMWLGNGPKCEPLLALPLQSPVYCVELTYGGGNLYIRNVSPGGDDVSLNGELLKNELVPLYKGDGILIDNIKVTIEYLQ